MARSKTIYILVQLLGLAGAGIGALTLCGYMVGKPNLYTWDGGIGMAYNTSVAITLYGIAIYLIGKDINNLK